MLAFPADTLSPSKRPAPAIYESERIGAEREMAKHWMKIAELTIAEGKTAEFSFNVKTNEFRMHAPWDNVTKEEMMELTDFAYDLRDCLEAALRR